MHQEGQGLEPRMATNHMLVWRWTNGHLPMAGPRHARVEEGRGQVESRDRVYIASKEIVIVFAKSNVLSIKNTTYN